MREERRRKVGREWSPCWSTLTRNPHQNESSANTYYEKSPTTVYLERMSFARSDLLSNPFGDIFWSASSNLPPQSVHGVQEIQAERYELYWRRHRATQLHASQPSKRWLWEDMPDVHDNGVGLGRTSSKNKAPYLRERQRFALNLRVWSIYRLGFFSISWKFKSAPRVRGRGLVLGQPRTTGSFLRVLVPCFRDAA